MKRAKRKQPTVRDAVRGKIASLRSEAARLANHLVGEEKLISRLQRLQSDTAAKLARAAAHKSDCGEYC
jgi:hypothetical protein